jgi:hypothetical protein
MARPLSPASLSTLASSPVASPASPVPGTTPLTPLVTVLAQVADFRQAQGKRHPLVAGALWALALACAAMLCGARGCQAIADWGRNYDPDLMRALGFTHPKTPCASTLHTIFRHLDWEALEANLRHWAEALLGSRLPSTEAVQAAPARCLEGLAIDGKTLRGAQAGLGPEPPALGGEPSPGADADP